MIFEKSALLSEPGFVGLKGLMRNF